MSYSSEIDGLELFTAPFRNPQAYMAAPASRPQQPKTTATQPKAAVSPAQQPKAAASQPQTVKPKAPVTQPQKPDVPKKSVSDEKMSALQTGQAKVTEKEPEPEQNPQAETPAPAKAQPSAQAQPEPPKKELTMDMSDRTIPAGKPLDASEDAKRKVHEEAETKRKAEWEAKQLAKKQAREVALKAIKAMSDADVVSASTERVRKDVERLTRRNMKECVAEHIQSVCRKDPVFARKTMHPHKSLIHCFRYINRMAKDYIQQEMKDNDIKPENGVYGSDVPDDLCYKWAEDYFNDMDVQEDHVEEEKFVPRPYVNTASKPKKTPKKTAKKEPKKKQEPEESYEQMSLTGVL